ncbi:MAG: glycosyltransferase family 4 protein [candidate division KSB1 bacterium]|nr:glycosyltransferase family 4 protein [candidate division KSB1 bacterium]
MMETDILEKEIQPNSTIVASHDRAKVVFISWANSCSRSDNIARELGGKSYKIYWGWLGSHPLTVWLKYFGQFLQTQWVLWREKPDVVFVMIPPLFASLAALPYCKLRNKPFIQDSHTAAFLHPRWQKLQWLQSWLCRHAATTNVTNSFLAKRVTDAGGHATLVRDVPVIYPIRSSFPRRDRFTVAVVCSFNYDEPIAEIFTAAARLPEVDFFVTGNPRDLAPELAENAPGNVQLTGFLPDDQYGALLKDADVVLTLTTRDHTMLRGAYEAIYLGTPVVISDWPVLREAFPKGAIHVNNTVESLVEGLRNAIQELPGLKEAAKQLREEKLQEWQQRMQELRRLFQK